MARKIPEDRFPALIEAGTATFIRQGYRRTQMQDVAEALGVAKGTVYAVVSSKEALLLACIRFADGIEPPPDPSTWPLPNPAAGELTSVVTERLGEVSQLALHGVADTPADGVAAEIELVVTDLMGRLATHRRAIKLVDRCAPEIPDLAQIWFGAGRAELVRQLAGYLSRREQQGLLRAASVADEWAVVARTVVEACVLWAVHLDWDPAPPAFRADLPVPVVSGILSRLFAAGLVDTNDSQE